MRRREVISLLAAWPLVAHAQQPNRVRHIGVFLGLAQSADDPGAGEVLRPFQAAMREAGWADGSNIRSDYRFGGGDLNKINASAAELVALAPELIYATGLPPMLGMDRSSRRTADAVDQVPGGRSRARRGRTYSATRYPSQPLRECIFWTTHQRAPMTFLALRRSRSNGIPTADRASGPDLHQRNQSLGWQEGRRSGQREKGARHPGAPFSLCSCYASRHG
jgi:hypothetical protein